MKKFLSLVLALVMTMSLVTVSAGAKEFTDDDKLTYEEAVNVVSEIGVVDGYTDGKFNPTNVLTRQAAAKIICNMILGPTTAAELHADTAPYKDVPLTSEFAGYIAYCQKEGIISGYADGTFRPGNTLTSYAFMKMLLGALGYDATTEQYTGPNWSINVAKKAINIGLTAGLESEFNGVKAVTREEACLYAFNTLQADLVEYETVVSTVINGERVNVGSTIAKAQRWNNSATKIENIKEDDYIQFAEQYFTKLKKLDDTDDFMRPAHTWTYNKAELGTYVDKDKLVESYTSGVTGRDVYDLLKSATIRDNDLECWIDGAENKDITKDLLVRKNESDLEGSGNGVLTEIYLDTDDEIITIVSINTYLAKATSSYNEKKESVALRVFETSANGTSKDVDLVDVPAIENVEKDEYYLVNMSEKNSTKLEVVELFDVEILSDSTVTKFSQKNEDDRAEGKLTKLTTGGTEYKNNEKAYYDFNNVLDQYNDSRLTDMTYNVFLDQYGYFIGVDLFDGVKNYVFITGYDMNKSNLSIKTADAAAIFTDGTMKVIEVNVQDTNKNIDKLDGVKDDGQSGNELFDLWTSNTVGCIKADNTDGNRQLNRWYTYTVDDGVYTLKPATRMIASDLKDIKGAEETTNDDGTKDYKAVINCSNVRLDGTTVDHTGTTPEGTVTHEEGGRAYGEDASVFITVDADDVSTSKNGDLDAITEVTGVYTGVQDVDIEMTTKDQKGIAHSIYTLFDSDNYIIASIILGDANGAVANYAYVLSGAKSEARIDGVYYWEFKAILDGEVKTLTVKSEFSDTILDLDKNHVQELRFDGDYVVAIDDVDAKDIYTDNSEKIDDERIYDIGHDNETTTNKKGETVPKYHDGCTYEDGKCDFLNTRLTAVAPEEATPEVMNATSNYIYLQGRTMYTSDDDQGLTFTKDAKAVVIQETNGDWDEEEYDSVSAAVAALDDPFTDTKELEFGGRIVAILNSNGVAEWVVIISDTEVETGTTKPVVSSGDLDKIEYADKKLTVTLTEAAAKDTAYTVTLSQVNGGEIVELNTYKITVDKDATTGELEIGALATGNQYKLTCGDYSTLIIA
ncbi:S-layer homology domain-containing protein [uncultured Dysosmobacter sp.]|uniref:S-layer homology domain-containing protein n=1 Tax=uncultured Dysosmobacter sp. TaxID=2591384 RepID=UPI0026372DBE|nr:S-layer homology domain-containing protein [uncultured Dysosmobacter sp.]